MTTELGGDPSRINPLQPVELVVDHSVQVDAFGTPQAFQTNVDLDYQRNQCIKAVSSGSFSGRGLGESGTSAPFYIPERHTDFVFSIIAEDLGFIGSSFLLILIALYATWW